MTWALILVLVWLPLQTPVAIAVFQYGHSETLARATLLLKDGVVALLLLYALAITWRSLSLRWFDKAAIAYVVVVGVYSIVPWLLGSQQPFSTVAASAREFVLPVEAYALGRLAYLTGVDLSLIFKVFVAASAVIAVTAILEYFILPINFWSSTLDLVSFERVVQGIPAAQSLWDISLLGDYGVGAGVYPRAIATFPHPVGAGAYFILPLGLTVAAWYGGEAAGKRLMAAGLVGLSLLFGLATIVTLSRGAWIAGVVVVALCGLLFRRLRMALLCLAVVGVFLASVPPFDESITSALNRSDSSFVGHIEAIGRDADAFLKNIVGMGLGSADRIGVYDTQTATPQTATPQTNPGSATNDGSGSETAGIGENLYLSVLVSTGPLGGITFSLWCLGVIVALLSAARKSARKWLFVGTAAALIGSLISAMTSSTLMRFTTAASSWLLLGLAMGLLLANATGATATTQDDVRVPARLRKLLRRSPAA
jgi:hypothetical protein